MINNIKEKVIIHIDIDAFFTTCEENRNSMFLNKPLVITEKNLKSIISAANYEARKLGIHSGMPYFKIKNSNVNVVSADIDYYKKISKNFFNYIKKMYTKDIQIDSIDECYMDASKLWRKYGTVKKLALKIKLDIKKKLNLTISTGISYNKFLAKMATNLSKPNGIGIITRDNYKQKLFNLDIDKIHGLGDKSILLYKSMNIYKIGQLYRYLRLIYTNKNNQNISKQQIKLYFKLSGNSNNIIKTNIKSKSVSHEKTLSNKTNNYQILISLLKEISESLELKMVKNGYVGKIIKLKIKNSDRKIISKQLKLDNYTSNNIIIYESSLELLNNFYDANNLYQPIRLIGIHISNLKYYFNNLVQLDIFNDSNDQSKIGEAVKNINSKYQKNIIIWNK